MTGRCIISVFYRVIVLSGLLFGSIVEARAGGLSTFGPIDLANGYPLWYQDANGLTLQHCLSQTGFCFTSEPNPALPISFPDNFGIEAFYFFASSTINLPSGGSALCTLALESSFFNFVSVIPGDQIV